MGVAPEFERLWRHPVLASQQDTLLQLQPLIEQTAGDQRADHPGDPQLIVVMTIQPSVLRARGIGGWPPASCIGGQTEEIQHQLQAAPECLAQGGAVQKFATMLEGEPGGLGIDRAELRQGKQPLDVVVVLFQPAGRHPPDLLQPTAAMIRRLMAVEGQQGIHVLLRVLSGGNRKVRPASGWPWV